MAGEYDVKPTAARRKELRAQLQRILNSFWGYTERQVYRVMVKDDSPKGRHYEDRQSEKVLACVADMRAWCDEVEAEYR
jgi:hypothetical protein